MPVTSTTATATASTTTLRFVEQVHLLRVYGTDTPPLTKGNLLKKFETTSESRRQLLRWPDPIYMRVGYVFESRFSAEMV